ncbi:DUF5753 domain-containing protein [Streptomyces flaveus]|uniref:DUF5753 domain-containing protein n=1 Tax=Streptomyces flaveus TaxID=66370 RepID=UPI0027E4B8BC|nr:DUF5753 domain-containing protein [Streptomyces flaveus]
MLNVGSRKRRRRGRRSRWLCRPHGNGLVRYGPWIRRCTSATANVPPRLHAIIHEAALHMVIGGPHVMRDQLAHLIRAAAHEHVTVQVLPFDRAHHTWVSAPFLFLSPGVPGLETVFIEHPAAALSLHEAQDLAHYRATVATLARNALPAIVPTASPDRHEERDSWGLIQHVLYTHRGAPQ